MPQDDKPIDVGGLEEVGQGDNLIERDEDVGPNDDGTMEDLQQ